MEGKKNLQGGNTLPLKDRMNRPQHFQKLFRLFKHLTSPLPTRGRNETNPLRGEKECFSEFLKLRSYSQVYCTLGLFSFLKKEEHLTELQFLKRKKKGFFVW
jgi:hypothetical protein